jgi:hypothetical protein
MQNELIIVSEYCDKCHIEPSFIEMLQEIGLIDIRTEGGKRWQNATGIICMNQIPNIC